MHKKAVAAVSAVIQYIDTTRDTDRTPAPAFVRSPTASMSMWAAAGRQVQMSNRTLMQMKTFHRT